MEPKTIKNIERTIELENKKLEHDPVRVAFEKASIEFEKLVKSGLVKRRGYNLITIEDKHLHQFSTNLITENSDIENL